MTAARQSMDARLAHGVAWTGGVKWAIQLLSWFVTLLTAKLLVPADYGYLAVLTVITRFMLLITEGGVGAAIVNGPQLDDRQLRQLHSVSSLAGLGSFAVVLLISIPLSLYFHDGNVTSVLAVLGGTLVLEGLTIVPNARLKRQLDFRTTAMADGARSLTDLGVTLGLAALGARYWSLVIGYSSGLLVWSALIHAKSRVSFERPEWTRLAPVLRFSRQLLGRNVSGFLAFSGDAPIGKLAMSRDALGLYTLAFTIAYAPAEKITQIILRVVPAILGNVRDSTSEVARYFLAVTSVVALVTFPMFAGIAFVAPDLVLVLLGEKWAPMVPVIIPLCIYGAITEALAMVSHVLQAVGETRVLMRNGMLALLVMPLSFLVLSQSFGAPGLAAAWAVGTVILSVYPLRVACRRVGVTATQFLGTVGMPIVATGAMLLLLFGIDTNPAVRDSSPLQRLLLHIAAGALCYSITIYLLARAKVQGLWTLGRSVLAARRLPTGRVVAASPRACVPE
ncbi:MAG: lipopolysaccharide biosynthesis protein [Gemmatimonadaceae bacterium]|nr:lipopolysaccharide biosynthesis protein [Gemmatimonadaceae bacterium]